MACISKISGAITYDCDSGGTGLVSALLINKEDIESITFADLNSSWVDAITLKTGAKVYKIDTPKRTLVVTESLKVNEGAPNAYTHSASVVVTNPKLWGTLFDIINPVANGSFVILTKPVATQTAQGASYGCRIYGLFYGLSATAVDRSSHDNGAWYTVTMATPERVIGENALAFKPATYDTLYGSAEG